MDVNQVGGGVGLKHLAWSVITVFLCFFFKDFFFKATWKTVTGSSTNSFVETLYEVVDDEVNRRQRITYPSEKPMTSTILEKLKSTKFEELN